MILSSTKSQLLSDSDNLLRYFNHKCVYLKHMNLLKTVWSTRGEWGKAWLLTKQPIIFIQQNHVWKNIVRSESNQISKSRLHVTWLNFHSVSYDNSWPDKILDDSTKPWCQLLDANKFMYSITFDPKQCSNNINYQSYMMKDTIWGIKERIGHSTLVILDTQLHDNSSIYKKNGQTA